MVHLWVRAEPDPRDERVALLPDGARALVRRGLAVTVEHSRTRAVPSEAYRAAGCALAPEGSWPAAPRDALVLGLGLPTADIPLVHRHAAFGPGEEDPAARGRLLGRLRQGGGAFTDLASLAGQGGGALVDLSYRQGYAAAAVALRAWLAQAEGGIAGPLDAYPSAAALVTILADRLERRQAGRPGVLLTGAFGRAGAGAADFCAALALPLSRLDLAGDADAQEAPDPLGFEIFLDGIGAGGAGPGLPAPLPPDAATRPRRLGVVGRLAGRSGGFDPVGWERPARRLHEAPPLDLVALAAASALLPAEASRDLAAQILPALMDLDTPGSPLRALAEAAPPRDGARAGERQ